MSQSNAENRHAPTQLRLQEAQKDGNFARSSQLSSLLFCCGAFAVLLLLGNGVVKQIADATTSSLAVSPGTSGADLVGDSSIRLWNIATTIMPMLLMFCGVAWLAHAWQSRFQFYPKRLTVDFEKLHPGNNLARLFSARTLWNAFIGLLRMLCVLGFGLSLIWTMREHIGIIGTAPRADIFNSVIEIVMWILGGGLAVMFIFGIIDWLWQVKSHEASLRMDDQQMRDELRSTEGDPNVRSRQRNLRHRLANDGIESYEKIEERP